MIGAFCFVWREDRYLPLILEQLDALDRPTVIIHSRWPFYWQLEGDPPDGFKSPVADLISDRQDVIRWGADHIGRDDGTAQVVNLALRLLQEAGCDTAIWMDSDALFDLDDIQALRDVVESKKEPVMWSVPCTHYWGDFRTAYSTGRFRNVIPAHAKFTGRTGFDPEMEKVFELAPDSIYCYHPSYVLSHEEIERKVNTWFHAPEYQILFKEMGGFAAAWRKGIAHTAPFVPDLFTVDGPPPSIMARLRKHNALLPKGEKGG